MAKFNSVAASITAKCLELILKNPDPTRPWTEYVEIKNNTIYATNGYVAIKTSDPAAIFELIGDTCPKDGLYLMVKGSQLGQYLFRPSTQPNTTYPNVQRVIEAAPTDSITKAIVPEFLAQIKQSLRDQNRMPITLDYQRGCFNLYPCTSLSDGESTKQYTTVNAAFLAPFAGGFECFIHSNTTNPNKNIALTLDKKLPTRSDLVYLICPLKGINPSLFTTTTKGSI